MTEQTISELGLRQVREAVEKYRVEIFESVKNVHALHVIALVPKLLARLEAAETELKALRRENEKLTKASKAARERANASRSELRALKKSQQPNQRRR